MRADLATPSLLCSLLLLASAVKAQELHVLVPPSVPDIGHFSAGLAVGNGLVLASNHTHGPNNQGRVEVFDRHTGQHRRSLVATTPIDDDYFGGRIALSEDWTLIGSRRATPSDWSSGAVHLFDPVTGEELRKFTPPDGLHGQGFGVSIAIDGDLALIGASHDDTQGSYSGAAYLIHIPTGALVHKLIGSDCRFFSHFGALVALGGGRAVAISSHDTKGTGAFYVFDAVTGLELYKRTGSGVHRYAHFGSMLHMHGDRLLVGAYSENNHGLERSGAAYLFDLNTGVELHRFVSPQPYVRAGFGYAGMLDDNHIIITEPGDANYFNTKGRAFVFDAQTFELLETIQPSDNQEGDLFGLSIASQGCEVVISSPWADSVGPYTGKAYVFPSPGALGESTCDANRNSTGAPAVLTAEGSTCVAANLLTLSASTLPPNVRGSFLVSRGTDFVPFVGGSQGNLCLAAPLGRFTDPPFFSMPWGIAWGHIDLNDLPLGSHAVQPGETWYFQAWYYDFNPGLTSNLTNGLEVVFR